jgi:hypothetical protein
MQQVASFLAEVAFGMRQEKLIPLKVPLWKRIRRAIVVN